ncbi:MAG: RluA family pseudouridine synthase [Candidatus Izemoplasmatales bacterium]|jgi:RluA family pseudouridine synthase
MNIAIIYEDDQILIVDKPVNLLIHPASRLKQKDLLSAIGHHEYGVVTRLDYQTQGLVLLGKTKNSLSLLSIFQRHNKIKKYYQAIVSGYFPETEGTYRCYLLKDEESALVRTASEKIKGSRETITKYRVIEENQELSLVEIELVTGRFHQIRAVMAHFNHPLLGDPLYGNKSLNRRYNLNHQALVSMRLEFSDIEREHPLAYLEGKVFEKNNFPFLNIMKKR